MASESTWTEAEIRAALEGHDPYPMDNDEEYGVFCRCSQWKCYDTEHILDVLKANSA